MSSSSPFDDSQGAVAPPSAEEKRSRRPWWRWNLITLALALFALAWIRELTQMPLSSTWLLVFSLMGTWLIVPAFFVPTRLTTMTAMQAQVTSSHDGPALRPISGNAALGFFRILSVILAVASLIHLVFSVVAWFQASYSGAFGRSFGSQWLVMQIQLVGVVAQPLFEMAAAGCLFVLTEIALRLESLRSGKD